jgi:hypothetical protein
MKVGAGILGSRTQALLSAFFVVAALVATLWFAAEAMAVDEDITPPQLDALSVSPSTVDVTTGSKTVTVTATITDPAAPGGVSSGANSASIFYSPPGGGFGTTVSGFLSRTSGDQFSGTVTFPQFIAEGLWTASVSVADRVGNSRFYGSTQLHDAGFDADVDVTSTPDTTAPELGSLTVGPPTAVTVSNGSQSVPATATATDDISGVNFISISYESPSGAHSAFGSLTRTSGDNFAGSITFRQYQEAGTWTPTGVSVSDRAQPQNVLTLSGAELAALNLPDIEVTSDPVDLDPPELVSLTAEPACTDPAVRGACVDATTQDQTVTVKATITDNLSGANGLFLSYSSPTGIQSGFVFLHRTTGNNFQGQLVIRQFAQAGRWKPCFTFFPGSPCTVTISDNVGNFASVDLNDFPDAFIAVTRTAADEVPPGGQISTGDSANPINPIQSLLSIPPGGTGGPVELVITPRTTETPPNFYLLDQQLDITAPAQPDTSHPMKIEFLVDSSVFTSNPQVELPPACIAPLGAPPPDSCPLTVFKDGNEVEACTAVPPSAISPDPCVVLPQENVDDDRKITIYTTTASSWNVGVDLTISENEPPDCTNVAASKRMLWPPNHALRELTLQGGSDPDGDDLTFTITGITQDEPVNGKGDGNTAPDAKVDAVPGKFFVRAERSGKGDGRVYRISYELSDGTESCEGIAKVSVPHDAKRAARDSAPPGYNSLAR